MKNKKLINYLGLCGIIAFLSYLAALIFSPMAYPGYDWLRQAASDLSADGAPSLKLWNTLSALYSAFNLLTMVIAAIVASTSNSNKVLKIGIYVYACMTLLSTVGYRMFPLSEAGNAGTFQDIMHIYVVTIGVVLLSIAGLVLCIIGGIRKRGSKLIFISAIVCLSLMMIGALGTNVVPKEIFGLFERFSTISATAFGAILGIWAFKSDIEMKSSTCKAVEQKESRPET